jgi:hypothetical protein
MAVKPQQTHHDMVQNTKHVCWMTHKFSKNTLEREKGNVFSVSQITKTWKWKKINIEKQDMKMTCKNIDVDNEVVGRKKCL